MIPFDMLIYDSIVCAPILFETSLFEVTARHQYFLLKGPF